MSASGARSRFMRSFLKSPRQVGAVLPTSRRAVRDTLSLAPIESANVVVELGAGTGVYTAEILRRLGPDGNLLAFEIDAALASGLSDRFDDDRLEVVSGSAENLHEHLHGAKADVIVSAVPFASLPESARERIFAQVVEGLAPDGVFLAIQYSTVRQRELERRFASVRRRRSPINIPPAFVYACRDPRVREQQP